MAVNLRLSIWSPVTSSCLQHRASLLCLLVLGVHEGSWKGGNGTGLASVCGLHDSSRGHLEDLQEMIAVAKSGIFVPEAAGDQVVVRTVAHIWCGLGHIS